MIAPDLTDAVVIKHGNLLLICRPDGSLPAEEPHPLGLWFRDCRFLSAHELRVAGRVMELRMCSDERGDEALHVLSNREMSVEVRLERRLESCGMLRERIAVRSFARAPLRFSLQLRLGADFEPMLAVRGLVPRRAHPAARLERAGFSAVGRDDVRRTTSIAVAPSPSWREAGTLGFELGLEPGGETDIRLELCAREEGAPRAAVSRASRGPTPEPTRLRADDQLFQRILDRSLLDLAMLRSRLDGHSYYAAGLPWFATLFGRDSLITAMQTLWLDPGTAEDTLRLLASRLGRAHDEARGEEPGKVLHEWRVGEPSALGETVFSRYYGSADATPLFLIVLCLHADWTGSLDLFRELRPEIAAALAWIDHAGHSDGLVRYRRGADDGLVNQGWKDSPDGVPDEDGEPLAAPVALVEVQGYVVQAKRLLARLFEHDGDGAQAEGLRSEATRVEQALDAFRAPGGGGFAIGLDGQGRPGSALSSNQGHLLWAQATIDVHAERIRSLLMSDAMFTGWGIRTLAEGHPAYNPLGYHTGSVWPHDSALIAAGLRRYGYDEDFGRIFEGVLDAASRFGGYRMPELFGGQPRGELGPPVPYPVACRPQAWAAGAIPHLLGEGLGLRPDALERRLRIVRPILPSWLGHLEVEGLRLAGAHIDLRFERAGDRVALAHVRVEGEAVEVIEDL